MKPELISFKLCPFVQRSVIILLEKKADFDITYIDLKNPPQWFLDISPFGKVPVLRVNNEAVFESVVINEYLDDITPPSMHPADPLQRAINKAWIEFASQMLVALYHYCTSETEESFKQSIETFKKLISQLETKLGDGPFFNGETISLIDAAFAPFFMRIDLLESVINNELFVSSPKVRQWANNLVSLDSVVKSVIPNFADKYMSFVSGSDTYTGRVFKEATRVLA